MKPPEAMQRALALARRGVGMTRPNPPVGAVLVKGGRIVGEGWHRDAGRPHAEVEAILRAGASARGADLFVTLEPCCTQGRTPPCTEAIRAAGIHRVWVATRDPNPRHQGRGIRLLRRMGIETHVGLEADVAQALIEPFAARMLQGRPRVLLKMACTLDGRIADPSGRSRWISGTAARERVQELRRASDAVLVGAETVCVDDPGLLPHPARGRSPWRVVVDSRGRTPLSAAILRTKPEQTIVAVTSRCDPARRKAYEKRGTRCWVFDPDRHGHVPVGALLRRLSKECDVMQVLCEGGGMLAGSLLGGGWVDELHWIVAPRWLGPDARPAISGASSSLRGPAPFRIVAEQRRGTDVWMTLAPCARGKPRRPRTTRD